MEKRDYLMDQIEQLGRVLGKILAQLLGLKNQGRVTDGIGIANQTLKSELDFDIDEIASLSNETLIEVLIEKKKFTFLHLEHLAEILLLIADDLYIDEPTNMKSQNLYDKCLSMYNYLKDNDLTYSIERQAKIERIESLLYT